MRGDDTRRAAPSSVALTRATFSLKGRRARFRTAPPRSAIRSLQLHQLPRDVGTRLVAVLALKDAGAEDARRRCDLFKKGTAAGFPAGVVDMRVFGAHVAHVLA